MKRDIIDLNVANAIKSIRLFKGINKQISLAHVLSMSKENAIVNEINIYPNPANEILYIDMKALNTTKVLNIVFTDICGRTIKSTKVEQIENMLDIKDLASGVYLLTITNSNNGFLYKCKLLKE